MTDNPWLPIDTMPLSTVGTEIDVKDKKRLHSGVLVSGIKLIHLLEDGVFGIHPDPRLGHLNVFTIQTTTGDLRITPEALWRPHVTSGGRS